MEHPLPPELVQKIVEISQLAAKVAADEIINQTEFANPQEGIDKIEIGTLGEIEGMEAEVTITNEFDNAYLQEWVDKNEIRVGLHEFTSLKATKEELTNKMYAVILEDVLHEVVHILDKERHQEQDVFPDAEDRAQYFQSKAEIRAHVTAGLEALRQLVKQYSETSWRCQQ